MRGSTDYVCVLDIVKAFDKVNHYCLYTKLIRTMFRAVFECNYKLVQ